VEGVVGGDHSVWKVWWVFEYRSYLAIAVVYRWVTGCCCWKLLFPFINARSVSFPIVSASPYATK
jgi:hypothetical protein